MDHIVTVTPYALKKMGIVQPQTSLKIDVYTLICVPYRISMGKIALLLSFTQEEVVFFQKFKGGLAGLTLVFQESPQKAPLKLFARCAVAAIAPVKNRLNVALITLDLKPCPDDLVVILGDYLSSIENLKAEYSEHRGKPVTLSPAVAKALGYNNYAVFTSPKGNLRFSLFSVDVDSAEMLFPSTCPDIEPGSACSIRLYFRSFQFSVPGKIVKAKRLPTGVLRAMMKLDFSPELSEILSHFGSNDHLVLKNGKASPG